MLAGNASDARPTDEADAPASSRRMYLDAAEPLTAWRVDVAVLVGVAQYTVALERSRPEARLAA